MAVPTFASMTGELTDEELGTLDGDPVWGIIPAHPFGSTVRLILERRILVRNIYAYAPGHNPTEAQRLWARGHHLRSFRNRFPMFDHMEVRIHLGWHVVSVGRRQPDLRHDGAGCCRIVGLQRRWHCARFAMRQVTGRPYHRPRH